MKQNSGKLTILQINDTHGYLDEHQEMFWDADGIRHERIGGYARMSGYFKRVREECGAEGVIALDNGDTLHGTYPAVHSEGSAFIEPLNLLGLDAWTVHWDFVFGTSKLQEIANKLHYPLLACNCHRKDTDEMPFMPTLTLMRGGMKVGIIGIAAYIIDKNFPPRFSEGLYFTLGKEELPRHIKQLREQEKVDLVIVLSHLGFPQDCKLAGEVDGIDILLSGHTHNRMYQPAEINGATIIQSGCHASFIGRLDVTVDEGRITQIGHQLVKLDGSVESDPVMQSIVEKIYAPYRQMLDEIAGETLTHLNRYTTLESTMDNLLLDAVARTAGTEIAFSNGWRYGAPVPIGPVTVNDLWNIIPTDPYVETLDMTGAELWAMMEDNLEKTFSADAYKQMGGFVKRCRGITVCFKIENPAGARIQEFFAGGARLDKNMKYKVAFVSEQAVPKKYGSDRRNTGVRAIDALKRYFAEQGSISAELRNTIIAV